MSNNLSPLLNVPSGWKITMKETPSYSIAEMFPDKIQWVGSIRVCFRKEELRPDVSPSDMLKERFRKRNKLPVDAKVDIDIEKMTLNTGNVYYYSTELVSAPNIIAVYGLVKTEQGQEIHIDVKKSDLGEILEDTFDKDFRRLVKAIFNAPLR